jgi:hypothetical protein
VKVIAGSLSDSSRLKGGLEKELAIFNREYIYTGSIKFKAKKWEK